MIKIHFYTMPDDQEEYIQADNAHIAWRAVDRALDKIRNHQKHGSMTKDEVIEEVRKILWDAQGQIA